MSVVGGQAGAVGLIEGVPPPSPALLQALAGLRPVRLRRPGRSLLVVGGLSLAWGGLWLSQLPRRADLRYLPLAWWALIGLGWLLAFAAPLALALTPRRGAVLPDAGRAGTVAAAAALAMVALGLWLTPDAPGHTVVPAGAALAASLAGCFAFALLIALVPLLAGALALRRLLPVGGARLLAATGAAGGALGGLLLHVACPVGGGLHVGVAHGGAVVAATLIGTAVGATFDRWGRWDRWNHRDRRDHRS
jgi:hypothetical protein